MALQPDLFFILLRLLNPNSILVKSKGYKSDERRNERIEKLFLDKPSCQACSRHASWLLKPSFKAQTLFFQSSEFPRFRPPIRISSLVFLENRQKSGSFGLPPAVLERKPSGMISCS